MSINKNLTFLEKKNITCCMKALAKFKMQEKFKLVALFLLSVSLSLSDLISSSR